MITLIVGDTGLGKTVLACALKSYLEDRYRGRGKVPHIELDPLCAELGFDGAIKEIEKAMSSRYVGDLVLCSLSGMQDKDHRRVVREISGGKAVRVVRIEGYLSEKGMSDV